MRMLVPSGSHVVERASRRLALHTNVPHFYKQLHPKRTTESYPCVGPHVKRTCRTHAEHTTGQLTAGFPLIASLMLCTKDVRAPDSRLGRV
eukprot:5021356-Prymnesium_polylepis.1